jgi:molybdate transport system regulatory protein
MTRIRLRIDFDRDRYIGHGRIELLELIGRHGSIAQAAKAMGMSYLIDEFNSLFIEPLIARQHGGKGGGSASLTPFGERLVDEYRAMEAKAVSVFAEPITFFESHLVSNTVATTTSAKLRKPSG